MSIRQNINNWKKIFIITLCTLIGMPILHCSSSKKNKSIIRPKLIEQTDISVNTDCAFSAVDDMIIDKKNNFIIVDSYGTGSIYVFNENGNFIKTIGRAGKGPGEYLQPTSITLHPSGQLWVCDYMNRRINIYNNNYLFIKSFFTEGNRLQRHIFTPTNDDIVMYDGMLSPINNKLHDTIVKYNKSGQKIISFAPLQPEVLALNFFSGSNGIDFDKKGSIYEINPIFYQIRKYDLKGNLIKKQTPKSNIYLRRKKVIQINGPFIIGAKYIIVQIENHIDIYNHELVRIVTELPFREKIIYSNNNRFYTIIWPYENPQLEEDCVKIRCYELQDMEE